MQIPNRMPQAIARLQGSEQAPGLRGTVQFYQVGQNVILQVRVDGLPRSSQTGFFALHIHDGTSCAGAGFPLSGSHYDPVGVPHPQHAGDLPPLLSCNGRAFLVVMTDRFRLREVIGRTVIIHSGPDDFRTQPAGNPGIKIACGVIRRT